MTVSVLFAHRKSIYKDLPGCDVWDEDRDARNFTGSNSVICHPPCRGWCRLKAFSKHTPEELDLARLSVDLVRQNGGVLEHPQGSSLWNDKDLPRPGSGYDKYGGFTFGINQFDFGHQTLKPTWLYICGVLQNELPDYSLKFSNPSHYIGKSDKTLRVPDLPKSLREHTPVEMALFLIQIAILAGRTDRVMIRPGVFFLLSNPENSPSSPAESRGRFEPSEGEGTPVSQMRTVRNKEANVLVIPDISLKMRLFEGGHKS